MIGRGGLPRRRVFDAFLLAALAAIIAWPLWALHVGASPHDVRDGKANSGAAVKGAGTTTARSPQLREMPAFASPAAQREAFSPALRSVSAMRVALERAAGRALRATGDVRRLLQLARGTVSYPESVGANPYAYYPFRPRRFDAAIGHLVASRVTGERARRLNDLAALLITAAAIDQRLQRFEGFPAAAPLAYGILARIHGAGCVPSLNLAWLVSIDTVPRDDVVAREFARADMRCPDDPTPLWLLGQFQSQRSYIEPREEIGQPLPVLEARTRARRTFRALARRFPSSPAGFAGLADTELRLGYLSIGSQPFSARARFLRARTFYDRALSIARDPGLVAGRARALAALGRTSEAANAAVNAVSARPQSTRLRAWLVELLEKAGRFADAAKHGRLLVERRAALPIGPPLSVQVQIGDSSDPYDTSAPVSLQADEVAGVSLAVGPGLGGAAAGITDLSFIPKWHPIPGVTGHDRWCPAWSYRRDALLAGRPRVAMAGMPPSFAPIDGTGGCYPESSGTPDELLALAQLEAGATSRALKPFDAVFEMGGDPLPIVLRERQHELWRFAGDLERAARVAAAWALQAPRDPLPRERLAETRYLQRRLLDARAQFATARRLAAARRDTLSSARAQLKEGAALAELRRDDEARRALLASAVALRPLIAGPTTSTKRLKLPGRAPIVIPNVVEENPAGAEAQILAYYARVRAGDLSLRRRRFADAAREYGQARRVAPDFKFESATAPTGAVRGQVLDNNEAIAEIYRGSGTRALRLARSALAKDPESPLFLQTAGFAEEVLGHRQRAIDLYRRAVEKDPSLFPAANDLGVLLAKQGDLRAAERVLEQAVAANHRYARGWFNLGVVRGAQGWSHIVESQGALARAARLDHNLTGRKRELISDREPYFTTLDLSRPLPSEWSFSSAYERATIGLSLLAVLIAAFGAFGREFLGSRMSARALRGSRVLRRSGVASWSARSIPAGAGVLATMAFIAWPYRKDDLPLVEVLLIGAGALVIIAVFLRVRHRTGVRVSGAVSETRTGAIAVGAATTALGVSWLPLPHARQWHASWWIAPAVLAALTAALLWLGHATQVPATRALSAVALVMTASVLTPVPPMDGSHIRSRLVGLAVSLATLTAAALLALRII